MKVAAVTLSLVDLWSMKLKKFEWVGYFLAFAIFKAIETKMELTD